MTAASLRIRPSLGEIIIIIKISLVKVASVPHRSLCAYLSVASPQLRSEYMNKFKSGRRSLRTL